MAYGLPDLNLVTMSETLAVDPQRSRASPSSRSSSTATTASAGFSNVVRTAVEFDRAGVAAICIEDNLFPKRNSLYQGAVPARARPDRASRPAGSGAAKAAQESERFVVIARVEALIAGHGVDAPRSSGPTATPTRVRTRS